MWTNRRDHAEAILNNSVGYIRIKPNPGLYRPQSGPVNLARRSQVAEWLVARIHEKMDPARITLSYPGDVWVSVTPMAPIESFEKDGEDVSEVIDFLDWLGSQTITLYQGGDGEGADVSVARGVPLEFSFVLDKWAPRDPEAVSMGNAKMPQDGGLKIPGV